jgi:SAM-dependent MidA family methyltransferase
MGASPATPSFGRILHERIARDGPLGFADFMAAALYDPQHGYYASGTRQIGRAGDFFTSVSVGPLFGTLLARRFLREWHESDCPQRWRIIECGAHDGSLAADILTEIQAQDARAFEALEYSIPEPLPALQAAQRKALAGFAETMRFPADAAALADDPLPGIAFGNELLDALPCHIVEWRENRWLECRVAANAEGGFTWQTGDIHDPLLIAALAPLGSAFPEGYRTEVRTSYAGFLAPLARALDGGLMVWVDYGFARPDYYHPDRTAGTFRTFSKHRPGENPLAQPGEADLTAHVDFTAVAEAAISLGGQPLVFQNQGAWLTGIARDWLLEQEGNPNPQALRQFQTLTHPAHLGRAFHVLELSWRRSPTQDDRATLDHRLFGSPRGFPPTAVD